MELPLADALNGAIQVWYTVDMDTLEVTRLRHVNSSGRPFKVFFHPTGGSYREFQLGATTDGNRALPKGTIKLYYIDPVNEPEALALDGNAGIVSV